jgi:hypothetical protein
MVDGISNAIDTVVELAKRKPTKQEKAIAEQQANNGIRICPKIT